MKSLSPPIPVGIASRVGYKANWKVTLWCRRSSYEVAEAGLRKRCHLEARKIMNAGVHRFASNTGRRRAFAQRAFICYALTAVASVMAQGPEGKTGESPPQSTSGKEELAAAPTKVDINPIAHDQEISKRIQSVLEATGWFLDPTVEVDEGVVFLNGGVKSNDLKKWATELARNTQDVVAVANRMEVVQPSAWDFQPAWGGLASLWRDILRSTPWLVFGLIILAVSAGVGILATRVARGFFRDRIRARLLRSVITRGIGLFVFLFGVYLILRVSGLTQLALTVVGGTGLIGLVLGIAFRDITENFLASIFLSMQQPFETGDLVEIDGVTGYVQQLNVRTTILMTLEGHLVQIPNATIYKTNLRNFTTNSNRREDFVVGIGYEDSISDAQEVARKVLADHPAVLTDPEPSVLADSMGRATINLRIYFWLNGREHSWLKVRSSVIRLVKRAFQQHGISMPDEAREVVFPKGVPVTMLESKESQQFVGTRKMPLAETSDPSPDVVSTKAEAGLYSEAGIIEGQARQVQPLRKEENLLQSSIVSPASKQ